MKKVREERCWKVVRRENTGRLVSALARNVGLRQVYMEGAWVQGQGWLLKKGWGLFCFKTHEDAEMWARTFDSPGHEVWEARGRGRMHRPPWVWAYNLIRENVAPDLMAEALFNPEQWQVKELPEGQVTYEEVKLIKRCGKRLR